MSNAINKILGTGTKVAEESSEYRSFVDSGKLPQVGFSITRANGDMDGFLYHSLDNMQLRTKNGFEYLTFTHRSKAVTIQGHQLSPILRAILRHTLMEIVEPDGRKAADNMPVITRMEISTAGEAAAPAARLVKAANQTS